MVLDETTRRKALTREEVAEKFGVVGDILKFDVPTRGAYKGMLVFITKDSVKKKK